MFDKIKTDLPNFPDEIIKDWLISHMCAESWPPDLHSASWRGILLKKSLDFWKGVEWRKIELDLENIYFSGESNNALKEMNDAYVLKQQNAFTGVGEKRFIDAFIYFLRKGIFPKPILLLKEGDTYEIADGHHRCLAWVTARRMYQLLIDSPSDEKTRLVESLKHKYSIDEVVMPPKTQNVWVASSKGH